MVAALGRPSREPLKGLDGFVRLPRPTPVNRPLGPERAADTVQRVRHLRIRHRRAHGLAATTPRQLRARISRSTGSTPKRSRYCSADSYKAWGGIDPARAPQASFRISLARCSSCSGSSRHCCSAAVGPSRRGPGGAADLARDGLEGRPLGRGRVLGLEHHVHRTLDGLRGRLRRTPSCRLHLLERRSFLDSRGGSAQAIGVPVGVFDVERPSTAARAVRQEAVRARSAVR